MKIDIRDGMMTFACGTLGGATTRSEFLASPPGASAKQRQAGNTRGQYDFYPEEGVAATAIFEDQRLDRVLLMMKLPSDDEKQWTETLELSRKARHDSWLAGALGPPPHQFQWGNVTSDYDPRGCASEIIVVYGQ